MSLESKASCLENSVPCKHCLRGCKGSWVAISCCGLQGKPTGRLAKRLWGYFFFPFLFMFPPDHSLKKSLFRLFWEEEWANSFPVYLVLFQIETMLSRRQAKGLPDQLCLHPCRLVNRCVLLSVIAKLSTGQFSLVNITWVGLGLFLFEIIT